jgi:hypothetical protein
MKTYIPSTDAEAQGLREGKITLVVIPATNDPSVKAIRLVEDAETLPTGKYTGWVKECSAPLGIPIVCPYALGDEINVLEPVSINTGNVIHVWFNLCLLCHSVEARMVGSIDFDTAVEAVPLIPTADTEGCYYEVGDLVTDDPIEAFQAEWHRRHPDLPFESAWAFFVTVERKVR